MVSYVKSQVRGGLPGFKVCSASSYLLTLGYSASFHLLISHYFHLKNEHNNSFISQGFYKE